MSYRSNRAAIEARLARARSAGLIAAATVYVNAVKLGLRGGYTSGAFVTGNVINSVTRSEPDLVRGEILVGTNVLYALYWELGHINLFLRRYVRKEVWMPALSESAARMRDAYAVAFRRVWAG
jgi:DNA-binding Lrp family transcriptional regulator